MKIDDKLVLLRKTMSASNIDACIIPTTDPHQSEYVADHWQARAWISGFTGSAGIATVTQDDAYIWTDSRYFIQAEQELADSEFELKKVIKQFAPIHVEYLIGTLPKGSTVGIDGWLFSKSQIDHLHKKFKAADINLNSSVDLLSEIWEDRPPLPSDHAFEHDLAFAGKSRIAKIEAIRKELKEKNVDHHLITTLDDIAWTLNIRGSDVPCNPVVISYLLISSETTTWFLNQDKLSKELLDQLKNDGISVEGYTDILQHLNELNESESILVDKLNCNSILHKAINAQEIVYGDNLPIAMKAIKNEVELKHFRNVMIKDGRALTKFYMWLESTISSRPVSEYEAGEKLASFRAQQELYRGESFEAIVGYKSNGAIVHYRASEHNCKDIKGEGMLLLDSGGQYLDGTTDITRTVYFGTPSAEEKTNYTLVLKGHIGLACAKFPKGTLGVQLDMLAREHLWESGLNYLHGTGHGVGFFLNVHEGPQGFSPGISSRSKCIFDAGMVTSNEPGYYKEGEYGIRIENLVITIESKDEGFLEHETITLFPIDTNLVDADIMTKSEIKWLNSYHQRVFDKLSPGLSEAEQLWLRDKCEAIAE